MSRRKRVSSKWKKTAALKADHTVSRHIPTTRVATQASVRSMLTTWGMVYLKPDNGAFGEGVMKAEYRKSARHGPVYALSLVSKARLYSQYSRFYSVFKRLTGGKRYVVQRGIRLLTSSGRPFDIRVMIVKHPRLGWQAAGIAGRVAHPGKIVTNGSQGGSIRPVEALLKPYSTNEQRRKVISRIKRLCLRASAVFNRTYAGQHLLGVDIALNRRLQPWILEINTRPQLKPFWKLKDKSMARKLLPYYKK